MEQLYIEQLNDIEKIVLKIAEEHLETSFSLENSIGFKSWLAEQLKVQAQAQVQQAQVEQAQVQEVQVQVEQVQAQVAHTQVQVEQVQAQSQTQQETVIKKKVIKKKKLIM